MRGDYMSKLILIPSNKQMIYDLIDIVDGYIIGIDSLAVNLPFTFTLNDAIESIKYLNSKDKDIFISLNKNMHNSDLDKLKETLITLDKYHITGIMYYDISIVNYKNELNLKNDLVWSAEHLVTNYNTINYWYNFDVKYAYLSSEITKKEIIDIKNNTKDKLLMNVFGYLPIFTSRRHLVDNYLSTFKKEKVSNLYYMFKEDNTYPVIDNKEGTVTYSGYVLNNIKDYLNLNIDYAIINSFLINDIKEIVEIFKEVNTNNIDKSYNRINDLIKNTNEGFLYKETIYKVK